MSFSFKDSAVLLYRYWPLLAALGGGAAWAADKYIDQRIDSKLERVEQALDRIEKKLIVIDEQHKFFEKEREREAKQRTGP